MSQPQDIDPSIMDQIIRSVKEIKYGSVEIVIHDGKVVQVQKLEKFRFDLKKP